MLFIRKGRVKKMRKYKYVVLAAALLFLSQEAYSQPLGWGMGRGMGYRGIGYANAGYYMPNAGQQYAGYGYQNAYYPPALTLTQEQITKVNEIQMKFQNENLDLLNDLQRKNLELQNLLMVEPVDQSATNYKIEEINKMQADLQKKMLAQNEKMRNVLTDEQKALYGNAGVSPGLQAYGMGMGYAGMGMRGGRFGGGGFGMGRRGMMGAGRGFYGRGMIGWGGRGPCGMGLGRSAGMGWW